MLLKLYTVLINFPPKVFPAWVYSYVLKTYFLIFLIIYSSFLIFGTALMIRSSFTLTINFMIFFQGKVVDDDIRP